MRRQTETIALGEHRFAVRPLTIAQVQAIEPLVFAERETPAASIATAIAILRVALARDHAEAAAELDALEVDAPDIGAAMAQVLRLGGFLPQGEQAPGEAGAGEAPAATLLSTGPGSTHG